MPRTRVVVALVPPQPLFDQVQTLRRAGGEQRLDRLPPHLTLIPPVNVALDSIGEARSVLRAAAQRHRPFDLTVGPSATFGPVTWTLHLAIDGALDELASLRRSCQASPFDRVDPREFVPHVTLRRSLDEALVPAAVATLSGELGPWHVDRLTLLEQQQDERAGTVWRAVHELPLGTPLTVGRGGIEVQMRSVSIVEPAVVELFGVELDHFSSSAEQVLTTSAASVEEPDVLLGAIVGRVGASCATIEGLAVRESHRGLGLARHLVAQWCSAAAAAGCRVAVTAESLQLDDSDASGVQQVLAQCGFVGLPGMLVRTL